MKSASRVIWATVALLVIVGMTFHLAQEAQSELNSTVGSRNLASSAAQFRNALQAAESSQRGYLASNNDIYLSPYSTAKPQAYQELQKLTDLLGPDEKTSPATQHLIVVLLDSLLSNLLEQLEVSMRDTGNHAFLKPDIAALSMPTDNSVNLGVIAAEWVTNAIKYAYPGGTGEIRVSLIKGEAGSAELRVEDDGGWSQRPSKTARHRAWQEAGQRDGGQSWRPCGLC